jgi:hypothetical protein
VSDNLYENFFLSPRQRFDACAGPSFFIGLYMMPMHRDIFGPMKMTFMSWSASAANPWADLVVSASVAGLVPLH